GLIRPCRIPGPGPLSCIFPNGHEIPPNRFSVGPSSAGFVTKKAGATDWRIPTAPQPGASFRPLERAPPADPASRGREPDGPWAGWSQPGKPSRPESPGQNPGNLPGKTPA